MKKDFHDWISLHYSNSFIVKKVLEEWLKLLNEQLPERVYHQFIKDHAGFFFADYDMYLTISKLKLGGILETDFVRIIDKRSNGLVYELIEIEKPQSRLFNNSGAPAKDFNNAIQQIRDWKRFLIDNKSWFKKFLPTYTTRIIQDSCIKYTIIIGRRTGNESEMEKRGQIAQEQGIEIRSFDYLTDLLKKRKFFNNACLDIDGDEILENQIENPFAQAITDSKWKAFCGSRINWTHFYKNHAKDIIKLRTYNSLVREMK